MYSNYNPWDFTTKEEVVNLAVNTETINQTKVSIYPNPATNKISIEVAEPVESAVIYNKSGEIVAQLAKSNSVNIQSLPQGKYCIKGNTVTNQHFISSFIKL